MSEQQGWIKIHRKMLDWEWYTDYPVFKLFIHLLITANHTPKSWRGQVINRGETVSSLPNLASQTGLSEQQIRTALKKLESTHEIVKRATHKYTVITLTNYEVYQDTEKSEQQTNNRQITDNQHSNNIQTTDNQQTNNRQITTNKNDKNDKNDKNVRSSSRRSSGATASANVPNGANLKQAMGEHEKVMISYQEFCDLITRVLHSKNYDTQTDATIVVYKYIEKLDEFLVNNPENKCKDHYKTICKWLKEDGYDNI